MLKTKPTISVLDMQKIGNFLTNPYLPVQMEFTIDETDDELYIYLRSCSKRDAEKLIEAKIKHSLISKITDELIYSHKTRHRMKELQFISSHINEGKDEVVYYSYYQVSSQIV